jgi:hypothetical protein
MNAPIALFVYNRPAHTRVTLESLSANIEAAGSDLFIFADGLKPGSTAAMRASVEEVRKVIRERQWCRKVEIMVSETNKGLANSIVQGVTEIVNRYGKVIVLEDDMQLSPYFLKFMNDGLRFYESNEKVISLTGYTWPV